MWKVFHHVAGEGQAMKTERETYRDDTSDRAKLVLVGAEVS
jgi:hypothetical protein